MKELVIRRATIDDLKDIQKLNNGLFEYESEMGLDTYIKDWALGDESKEYFTGLINDEFVIIAELDMKVVGYLAGSLYRDATFSYYEGLTAELDNMFIIEEYRKFGIGTKLINSFIEWCKNQGAKRILVTASIGYKNTIKFYEKCGFKDINITLRKDLC